MSVSSVDGAASLPAYPEIASTGSLASKNRAIDGDYKTQCYVIARQGRRRRLQATDCLAGRSEFPCGTDQPFDAEDWRLSVPMCPAGRPRRRMPRHSQCEMVRPLPEVEAESGMLKS